MNEMILFFPLFPMFALLHTMFVQATATSLCGIKRDASYTFFTYFSNDAIEYDKFFIEKFSECASSTLSSSQMPVVEGDIKGICALQRDSAYFTFTYFNVIQVQKN